MKTTQERLALLDLDGTLYPGTLGVRLLQELMDRGVSGPDALQAIRSAPADFQAGHEDFFTRASCFYDLLGKVLQGTTFVQVEQAASAVWEREHARLFPFVRPLVTALREADYQLVLVSGSPVEVVRLVAQELGIPLHHAARSESRHGRYTGRVLHRTAMPGGKRQVLSTLNADARFDLGASFALGDAPSDVELFEQVGLAVAFEPKPTLALLARERPWRVVDRHDILDVVLPLLTDAPRSVSSDTSPA
ncbi:MAG: HAD family hydrolase [Myxococcaceae bacterium]|nr:MAG: HAD family hydrolase [Myxococcaceae bacterium]